MQRMKLITTAALMFASCAAAAPAAVLDSATALWKFDAADSGAVSQAQLVDSNNGHNATSTTNTSLMSWTTTPAVGPGGTDAVDVFGDHGRGLQLNPLNTPGDPDFVDSTGFTVSNFTVAGSATFLTRFKWDGFVTDEERTSWLYNNGHGGSTGWLIGLQFIGGQARLGQFQYLNGNMRSPTSFVIQTDVWYDLAIVMLDDAEEGAGSDQLRFFLKAAGGPLLTAIINGPVNSTSGANTLVGSEILGSSATGNIRKAFDGTVDYIGVWDGALTDQQVLSVIVPEPASISVIALLGAAAMMRRRRV